MEIEDRSRWVEEVLGLLSKVGGGATAFPPVEGAWINPETGGLIREEAVIVYSYVNPDAFERSRRDLREFLHRMGRETRQGEIAFEFDGRFYRTWKFDGVDGAREERRRSTK